MQQCPAETITSLLPDGLGQFAVDALAPPASSAAAGEGAATHPPRAANITNGNGNSNGNAARKQPQ